MTQSASQNTQSSKALARGLEIVSGRFVAQGLAVDDNGSGLLRSIEDYSEDLRMPIKVQRVPFNTQEVLETKPDTDFLLVDHRLEGKYANFVDGLEVVEAIRSIDQRIPVFYYTAFEDDLYNRGSARRNTLSARAREVLGEPAWTYFYEKVDLKPDRRLNEFVQLIYLSSLGFALERLRGAVTPELSQLLQSDVVKVHSRTFQVSGSAGQGFTHLRELSSSMEHSGEDVVPSRLLRRAGITSKVRYCTQRIAEFSQGQVLSYFFPAQIVESQLSKRARAILEDLIG